MSAIPRDDLIRLRHMLDAARKARQFVQDRERTDLEMDEMLSLAIVRLLEIVGEAAAHISESVQASLPGIPWRQITYTPVCAGPPASNGKTGAPGAKLGS